MSSALQDAIGPHNTIIVLVFQRPILSRVLNHYSILRVCQHLRLSIQFLVSKLAFRYAVGGECVCVGGVTV